MSPEQAYVLGTHDEEVTRLGLQHRVWRPRVLEVWQRAGFGPGQTIFDLGCGPGYATLDLASLVGSTGRVVGFDRSRRFLDTLVGTAHVRGFSRIEAIEGDLDDLVLPAGAADGIWCRWAAAFVRRPRDLMTRVYGALKPGGVFVAHEYFDYGTWRFAPPLAELDEFVDLVIRSWREAGGEPNVGLDLPAWLGELGCEVDTRPIVDVIDPASPIWAWPKAFIQSGLARLVELGHLERARAGALASAIDTREHAPHARMITPAVMEIVARKSLG